MYLQMDGVNDYLQLPIMTIKTLTFDAIFPIQSSDLRMVLDARDGIGNGYVYARTSGTLTNAGAVFTETNFSFGSRITSDFVCREEFTDDVTIFASKIHGENFRGTIYDIKCFNAIGVLVARYDMSTGTVQDQSGNGNHATLVGGTWVSDAPTGTPVIYNYESEQQIYANRTNNYDLQQQVYKEIAQTFDTKLSLYQDILESYTTEQVIYRTVNVLYDTVQEIYSDSVQRTYNYGLHISIYADRTQVYDTRQESYKNTSNQYNLEQAIYKATQSNQDVNIILYADRKEIADTTQVIYTEREYIYSTEQSLYDPDKSLISTIKLDGERTLRIYLQGEIKKEYLKAERELYVKLKGVMQ